MGIGSLAPLVGKACRLRTHDDGCGLTHVVVVIFVGVLQLGREDAHLMLLEESDARL